MDEPKMLSGLSQSDYSYPLADVSYLSEEEKKDLLRRGMRRPKELYSDEEFEQWVTVFAEWNTYSHSNGHKPTEEERNSEKMATASYERGLWYHRKRFNEWKKEHLQPLIDELVEHAAHDPQYDWQYLYALECAKLRCMREAVKAKDRELKQVANFTFEEWCTLQGVEIPSSPSYPKETTETDIIAQMNIKERNRYLQLEAVAATIGKYIHPGGQFSSAREELQNGIMKPYSTDGNGKDTLIYAHVPSVEPQKVEEVFFELQKWHRQNERELNKMKFAIKKQAEKQTLENTHRFKQELEREKQCYMAFFTQYKEWQLKEQERISKLKINVPEALQETYDRLSRLEE